MFSITNNLFSAISSDKKNPAKQIGLTQHRKGSLLLVVIAAIALSISQPGTVSPYELDSKDNIFLSDDFRLNNTNPHFTGQYCEECHARIPEKGGDTHLLFGGNFNKLCSCHDYGPGKYIHPIGVKPSEEKKTKMPADFPLEEGVVSCTTCHDIYLQCQSSKFIPANKKFLRGGPYSKRTDICFRCHDNNKYKKLNPHNQLSASGEILEKQCLYCHIEKPDEKTATYATITLIGDIKMVCQRCHNIEHKHPAGADHFKKPTGKMLKRMKVTEIIYGTILPLDFDERVTCITCHNPHEKGVIPMEREGATGAGEAYKQRFATQICKACHDQYGI